MIDERFEETFLVQGGINVYSLVLIIIIWGFRVLVRGGSLTYLKKSMITKW